MSEGTARELLERLRGAGVRLSIDGEQLRFTAPAGVMTAELRAKIAGRKPEIIEFLRASGRVSAGAPRPAIARAPRTGPLPLSFAQQRMLVLHELDPESAAYTIAFARRLDGPLDVPALERALGDLVQRHEALRTTFAFVEGMPVQVIAERVSLPLRLIDLAACSGPEQEAEVARLAAAEAVRKWDLARGPLVCAQLVCCAADRHVLLITMHHIVTDGWSTDVFFRELAALYGARVRGGEAALAPLGIQYGDYAVWQRSWLRGDVLAGQAAYWRDALAGCGLVLDLPIAGLRPAVQTTAGATETVPLPDVLCAQVESLARREHATAFMVFLAAFGVLLHRYTACDDVLIGTPVANRHFAELEPLIGFFVNTLVVRVRCGGFPTFRELVVRVREAALGAYSHQDMPFERLVEELQPARDTSRNPVFQVAFAHQLRPGPAPAAAGVTFTEQDVPHETAKFDLMLTVRQGGASPVLRFQFNADLFARDTIARLAEHYRRLLETALTEPDKPVDDIALLTEQELRQLDEWNATDVAIPRERGVHELFEEQARQAPDAIALELDATSIRYAELDAKAARLAARLAALGARGGKFVAVHLDRSVEFVVTLLAILKTGAAYLPLDREYPAERLRFMLEDANVTIVVTQGLIAAGVAPAGVHVVDLAIAESESSGAGGEVAFSSARPGGDAPAYVIYTSGSTGRPKGAVIPHRAVVRLVRGQSYAAFGPGERFALLASPAFDASTFELWGPLLNGGTCVVFPQRWPDFEQLESGIRARGVTCLWLTAGLFNQIIDQRPGVLAGVRHVLTGGEALSVPHVRRALERLPDLRLTNGYGPTESTTFACTYPIPGDGRWPGGSVPIGRPIANTRCHILDVRGQPVPVGVPGELYLGGDGVGLGYLERPELTAERFVAGVGRARPGERLYRTGDRCRWLTHGSIEFLGRLDDQIKLRGFRIEPGEIESALCGHPAVAQAAVALRTEAGGANHLAAFVVARDGAEMAAGDLGAFLRARLPGYMVPVHYAVVSRLPLTANGKVDRRALLAAGHRELAASASHVAPRTAVENRLAVIWQRVLGRERVGLDDNFFEIGGTSLIAMRLAQEISAEFQQPLPLIRLFAAPTIGKLAGFFASPHVAGDPVGRGVLRGVGNGVPLFHMPGYGGFGFVPPAVVEQLRCDRQYFDGLQHRGLDGRRAPLDSVEAIAADLIEQIRSVCPTGPYCLNGYCYGGLVAYEVARQLTDAGETVTGVVMWDAFPARGLRRRAWADAWRVFHRRLTSQPRGQRQVFLRRCARAGWVRLRIMLGYRPVPAAAAQREFVQAYRDSIAADYRAIYSYRPKPYAGRVLCIRTPREEPEYILYEPLPLRGWDGLMAGPVEALDFSCKHLDLLKEPAISEAARRLAAFLRAGDRMARD